MRTLAFLFSLLGAVAWPDTFWITDVTIVSPERPPVRGSVLVKDGRIADVKRGGQAPGAARLVSGNGGYLIPGLIDSHVHLASIPGMTPDQVKTRPAMVQAYLRQLPRSYLYYGYTTLVDLAVIDRQVLEDFRTAPLHPDLYDCGESLPFANGYPMSFLPPATRFQFFPNFVADSTTGDHTPAAAVARVKSSGGICVKTYFERGFAADRNLPVMSPQLLAGIRTAATQAGLVLMIHANSLEAQKFGVDGQVDVLAHGMWNWGQLDKSPDLPPEISAVLDRIAERKIGYQPTIQVLEGELAYFEPHYLDSPAIPRVVPAQMLAWFRSEEGNWFKKELNEDGTPDQAMVTAFERGPLRRVRQVAAYLAARNADFLFGTDTPSAPTYGNLPGLNGYLEMRQLSKAGLSLEQIFRAATINNARKLHLDSQFGTIEPGKAANLVLLRKSPLESIEAYDSIVSVWVHGNRVSRDRLISDR